MAGRVDDNVVAPGAPKLNLRRIDRDVLVLLLGERIKDKSVLERPALRRARLLQALEFPVWERPRLSKNSPDKRGLAVIDVTDKNDLQTGRFAGSFRFPLSAFRFHMKPLARNFCMA